MAWSAYDTITVDESQCGTVDSSDFTVKVDITDNRLKQTGGGGLVTSAVANDVVFSSDTTPTYVSGWEIEFYDGTNGRIIAWVRLSTLSASTNTVFYMFVGNSAITTFQSPGSAWKSLFDAVYNFASLTTDSTGNGNTLTNNNSVTQVAGQVGSGADFEFSSNQYLSRTSAVTTAIDNCGCSTWIKAESNNAYYGYMGVGESTNGWGLTIEDSNIMSIFLPGVAFCTFGSAGDIGTGTWKLVHCERVSGVWTAYIDGVSKTVGSNTSTPNAVGAATYVGSQRGNLPNDGQQDVAKFWHGGTLGQSWFTAEYNNQKDSSTFYSESWTDLGGATAFPHHYYAQMRAA